MLFPPNQVIPQRRFEILDYRASSPLTPKHVPGTDYVGVRQFEQGFQFGVGLVFSLSEENGCSGFVYGGLGFHDVGVGVDTSLMHIHISSMDFQSMPVRILFQHVVLLSVVDKVVDGFLLDLRLD